MILQFDLALRHPRFAGLRRPLRPLRPAVDHWLRREQPMRMHAAERLDTLEAVVGVAPGHALQDSAIDAPGCNAAGIDERWMREANGSSRPASDEGARLGLSSGCNSLQPSSLRVIETTWRLWREPED